MPFDASAGIDHAVRKHKIQRADHRFKPGVVLRLVCFGAGKTGTLVFGDHHFACALGQSGRSFLKREGDGATPRGRYQLRSVFYRADRCGFPVSALPTLRLTKTDRWCDDPQSRSYNRPTRRLNSKSHETLWRDDGLYDIIIPLGFNDMAVRRGGGSAIFFHLLSKGNDPTEGCIAVSMRDMRKILSTCGKACAILI